MTNFYFQFPLHFILFFTDKGSYWGDHDWEAGDQYDAVARKAYEALLRVSLLQPTSDKFQDFADRVKERAYKDYNYTITDGEEVRECAHRIFQAICFYRIATAAASGKSRKVNRRDVDR